jgi:hypothetical protein
LGDVLEDHLRLTPTGEVAAVVNRTSAPADVRPLSAAVAVGIGAIVAVQSAPPLAALVRERGRALDIEWGPVEGDLLDLGPTRVRVSVLLRNRLAAALQTAETPVARAALALAALAEIALTIGDALRADAQQRLAGLSEDEQRARLTTPSAVGDEGDARVITDAAGALLADIAG